MGMKQGLEPNAVGLLIGLSLIVLPLGVGTIGILLNIDIVHSVTVAGTLALFSALGVFGLDRWRATTLDRQFVQLLTSLEAAGYFSHVPPAKLEAVRKSVIQERDPFLPATGRVFYCDAEDLAEGGVKDFLWELAPRLESYGVELSSISEDFRPDERTYNFRRGGKHEK
jgi:hypothetical protein